MKSKRLNDTRKIEKKGDECLKTGLFKWKKDQLAATTFYRSAAETYFKLKEYKDAIRAYTKASKANIEINDNWSTARCLEGVINCLIKMEVRKPREFVVVLNGAFIWYQMAESVTSYLTLVKEVSDYFEEHYDKDGQLAILKTGWKHIKKTDIVLDRNDLVFKMMELYVEKFLYLEAIQLAIFQYKFLVKKRPKAIKLMTFACSIIVLALLLKDLALAQRYLETFISEIPNFYSDRQCKFCEYMIRAFENQDGKAWKDKLMSSAAGFVFPSNIVSRARKVYFGSAVNFNPDDELQESQNPLQEGEDEDGDDAFF